MVTVKKLLAGKDKGVEYVLDGVKHPVKVDAVDGNTVSISGYDHAGTAKRSKMPVSYFCKVATIKEVGVKEATPSMPTELVAPEHLSKGQRFNLGETIGEVEIWTLTKNTVSYLSLDQAGLPDAERPEPMACTPEEFCTKVNEATLSRTGTFKAVDKTAPKVKKQGKVEEDLTVKKSSDKLQVDLTPEEVLAYYEKLSGLLEEMAGKESEKAAYVSQISGEIKELKAEINTLIGKVNSKKEFREVAITIEYHWKKNKKLIIRQDTGAVVSEAAIPKSELQDSFLEE